MNNYERIPLYVLLAFCVGVIGYFIFRKGPVQEEKKIEVVLRYDSLPKSINNSTIEKPVVYRAGEINIPPAQLQILQSQDTVLLRQVLQEIFSRYYEIRTQKTTSSDDSIEITTIDTLTENSIVGRKLSYKLRFPVSQTTIVNNPPNRNKLYVGASIEAGANGLYGISPELSFAMKKGTMIGIGYNTYALATGQDKYAFRISLSQKIRIKK